MSKAASNTATLDKRNFQALQDEAARYLIGNYGRWPVALESGQGSYVWDVEGKRYLDFTSGIAVNAGQPGESERNIALAAGLLLFILFTLHALPLFEIALVLAVAVIAAMLFGRLCERKIGGHTGDTIGACQQITEIVILVALALAA